jgi:NTE family protein
LDSTLHSLNKSLKKLFIISGFLILVVFLSQSLFAQQVSTRPKIGVALSGGGSLGMAHIGVLKVMEEAGLRPDYITGVSMGSIIGSMYSIGYRSDSLHYIFKHGDWNLILSNSVPEYKVIFTEKKYFNNSIISLPVSFKKLRLPSGLINGQQIEKMLSYYAWPAADINDFSRLPIPFLCVGTDLISCKKVILRSGYLPDAVRASMAVPSIFTPIKIDTAVLIDGGFVRNIAVSELKEMGADIIIGSYTGFLKYNENELQSVTGVMKQVSFFNAINDYSLQKKLIDYLIEPKVKDLSSTVFTNVDTIIQRGYNAALPFREKFKRLADSLNLIGRQEPAESLLDNKSYAFNRIEINGNKIISDDQILGVLDIRPGEQINKDMLSDKIDLLYGRSWFDKVKYRIVPGNDSLKLIIECIEQPQGLLYGSVHYDNALQAGLLLNLSVRNLLTPRSAIDIDSYIGEYFRFRFNYTQFIDRNQKIGISASFNTDNTLIPVMEIRDEIGPWVNRGFSTGLNLNKRYGLNYLMTISANLENTDLIPDFISAANLKRISYSYLTAAFINQLNTLDIKHFPNKGTILQLSLNSSKLLSGKIHTETDKESFDPENPGDFIFDRSYSAFGSLRKYFSSGKKFSFDIGGDILFTYTDNDETSPNNYYYAGGVKSLFGKSIPLTGFHPCEIPVEEFGAVRFDTDFEFYEKLHLTLMTNIALAREPDQAGDLSIFGGYGLGLGYMSIIGPMEIGFMHGISSTSRYYNSLKGYISIGFSF